MGGDKKFQVTLTNHVCPPMCAYFFDNALRRMFHDRQKLFSPYLKPGMTAADIGCGFGFAAIGMAKLVGSTGKIIAADVQQEMLDKTMKRALRTGVDKIITPHLCQPGRVGIEEKLDFAVTFYVVHEMPDASGFMVEINSMLKPGGKYLLIEPPHHVGKSAMKEYIEMATSTGLNLIGSPKIGFSMTALFEKP